MSWVRFLSGTQIFSLCHARGNISSLSNERCLRIFCRVIPVVRENLRIKFWQNILTIHFSPSNTFLVAAVVFLFKAILSPRLLFIIFFFKCHSLLVFISGSCRYSAASKAFIFSLYNKDGHNPVKLTQYQNRQYAMYHCSNYGPTFGHHAIYISNNALSNSGSHTNCGLTYSVPSGYSAGNCGFFTGAYHFTPTDIEVFYEIGN